ncbi:MAG TPA: orotidine-5'-phosphate decarboxylase [Clostridia bacterium]|nr:orotidine-5'-phosphate decarboxylase [Clostridia bacterium]
MDDLFARAKVSPVCLGLDTRHEYLPQYLKQSKMTVGEQIYEFNKKIIDATAEMVACFKVQIACYEALGLDGMACYSKTLQYAKSKGAIVIADVKRGDISSTAKQYAQGHFSGDFEADIITVNAYMGEDAVSPYYEYLDKKGLFVLVKTSNPSGVDFQDKLTDGEPLYLTTAKKVSEWGKTFIGNSGYSSIGAVVGCTYPSEFTKIKELMPNTFFLIPGYGAQGGTGKDIAEVFKGGICGVVNSSRGLITAHKGKTEEADFADYIAIATLDMKKDILKWL